MFLVIGFIVFLGVGTVYYMHTHTYIRKNAKCTSLQTQANVYRY